MAIRNRGYGAKGQAPIRQTAEMQYNSPQGGAGMAREAGEGGSSARLLALGEQIARLGSWELDLASGEMLWSDELYRILGREPQQGRLTLEQVLSHVHEDDRSRIAEIIELIRREPGAVAEEGFSTEFRAVRRNGEVRHARVTGRIERNVRGEPARWAGVFQDITEQASARELQAYHMLSETLRDWDGFEEGVVMLLARLGEALEYPMGSLWLWDQDRGGLTCRAFWSESENNPGSFDFVERNTVFRPGQGKPGVAWETEAPVVTEDVATDPVFEPKNAAMARGVRSALAFPAVGPDGPVAVLSFYSFEHRVPSSSLVRTLRAIGNDLGRFLYRRRAQLEPSPLTPRELQVLRLAAEGNTRPQIAEILTISPLTVKTHFENVFEKLGVSDRTAAVAEAIRSGLIE
jgi:PAS domain S-box-containing protein